MANQVTNRTVNIYIESGQAQKALDALVKKETQLKQELEKATNPKVIERLKSELAGLAEPIDRATKKLSGELSPSFKDVQTTVNNLANRLRRMSAEDADFEPVLAQYREARVELDAQTEKVGILRQAMNSFWKEAKTVAVGVIVGNTVQGALETVMGYVTGMITGSAKIADELSNIEKTTGLTTDQVKSLNSELSKIDTRTGTGQLREIAAGLGQIGEAATAANVAGIDKIVVALGDEFGGGAQEITNTLGVLRNNLQDIKTGNFGEDVLHIGNALNELGAKGLATAPVVTDIANRISGVGGTFGLTSGQILGTAATFQELGINAERGSTAFVKILQNMAAEPAKFAGVAGKSVKEFTQLVNTDMQAAFLAVAKGAKEAGVNNAAFGAVLKDLDADGSGAGEVLSKLATNAELLDEKVKLASDALKENNSITDEFSKLNNNAAGELEKLKKNFASLFSSSTVTEASAGFIRMLASFLNMLKATPAFIAENRTAIIALLGVLVTYAAAKANLTKASTLNRLATILETGADKIAAFYKGVATAATTAYGVAKDLLTGKIKLATVAQQAWNVVTRANPIGLIVGAIAAAATAVSYFTEKTVADTAEQQNHNDVLKEVQQQTSATKDEVATLTNILASSTATTDQKAKALERLKVIGDGYLDGLTLENALTEQGMSLIRNYIKHLDALADAKARVNLKAKLKEQLLETDNEISGLEVEKAQLGGDNKRGFFSFGGEDGKLFGIGGRNNYDAQQDINAKKKQKQDLQNRYNAVDADNKARVDAGLEAIKRLKETRAKFKAGSEQAKKIDLEIRTEEGKLSAYTGLDLTTTQPTAKTKPTTTTTTPAPKAPKTAKADSSRKRAGDEAKRLEESLRDLSLEFLPDDTLAQKFDKQFAELEKKFADKREDIEGAEGVTKEKKNALLLQLDEVYLKAKQQLYADQAKEFKALLKKEDDEEFKIRAERKANLEKLLPVAAKLEGSGLQLNKLLGRDAAAKAELADAKRSAKEKYDFLMQQLAEEKKAILANTELTQSEKDNLIRITDERIAQERKNRIVGQLQTALDFAKGAIDLYNIFAGAKTERENAELAADKAANDQKKKNLDDRLKKGLISQAEHDRQVAVIDKKAEQREKEIKLKQWKRNQKAQMVQAAMNGALAVTNILATMPKFDFGVASAIAIGVAVATTAAQIATIAGQKAPEYGTGGLLNGPSHAQNHGMPVTNPITGQVQAYLEGGEGIGSKRTMQDRRQYNVSGTPSQIYSLLNGINGGVTWQSGAKLRPAWSQQQPVPMNFDGINRSIGTVRRYYATGGKFEEAGSAAGSTTESGTAMMEMLQQLMATNAGLNATLQGMQEYGIMATVSLSQLEEQQKRKQAIKDDATWT